MNNSQAQTINEIALQKIAAGAAQIQKQRPAGTPIGYWNNNPGNLLSDGRTLWNGAKKVQPKGANLEFSDYGSGYRAMARTLYNYKAKHGLDTLQAILARYAKSATAAKRVAYEKFIRSKTGWKPGAKIDLTDTDTLHQLVPAMADFEIGPKFTAYHDPSVVSNAVLRAIPPK
jgi:hypothetical protein